MSDVTLIQRVKDLERQVAAFQDAILCKAPPIPLVDREENEQAQELAKLKERFLKLEMQYRALNARVAKVSKVDSRP